MQGVTKIIQQDLVRLLPAPIINDVSCFVFYDNHPQDEKKIDITICTKTGELREYHQRDLLSYLHLETSTAPKEIIILRSYSSDLFYIVSTVDDIFIVSSKETLQVHTKIPSVDKYTVDDWICNGQTHLKITKKDDAVPIMFDENFSGGEGLFQSKTVPESLPLFSELQRKYIEAQYTIKNNEHSVMKYIRMRHAMTLAAYQYLHPNHIDAVFKSSDNIYGTLRIRTEKPLVKVCNRKIIVAIKVVNEYKEPLENVHMLLKPATIDSLSYTTKLFDRIDTLPFWKEQSKTLLPDCEAAIVAVMSLDEIKPNVTSRIVLMGALSYKTLKKTMVLPLEDVVISSLETMGDELDALSSRKYDPNTLIAVISTTEKTDLRMRLIKSDEETLIELLIKHLEMERIGPDVLVYNKSPYHTLNGSMLCFTGVTGRSTTVTAYTRSKSQLLALIHCINDAVPSKIIITTLNYIVSAKTPDLSEFSEPIPGKMVYDYKGYATSVLNRTQTILEYLDMSMVTMSKNKDPVVVSKVGFETDLYACDVSDCEKFREKMMEEARMGVKQLMVIEK